MFSNSCYAHNYITNIENYSYLKYIVLIIFLIAYILVILEEFINIDKSKSVLISSGIIWSIVSIISIKTYNIKLIENLIKYNILEYAELFLFLFVAMTYINSMKDRGIFNILKVYIIKKKLSYKEIYWYTGFFAFFLSPIADNLTTALIMCSIITSISNDHKFINISCINIIVAANAGGAFSPFGDITTLMIWQNNILEFGSFFKIFIPSLICFLTTSLILNKNIPNKYPDYILTHNAKLKFGAKRIIVLFLFTIIISIFMQTYLHLPSIIGMMTGLGLLQLVELQDKRKKNRFNVYEQIKNIEWNTLLFFYGIMLCIGGLAAIGYLNDFSSYIYNISEENIPIKHQQTPGNIIIGLISAIIDNIPIIFAVLNMKPIMSEGQWLLITLTAGTGGSLLSIGSAAGIAIMGKTKGVYTFYSHLKYTWIILIGYFAGIISHLYINSNYF